uniref:MAM and LDL-receptor class A domain-containing protein 1-like n=1 Tax=Crassostrea virginica TaxID=6565 RepID=A0A8B8BQV0_CRAVI|nr:MAM and LDL-receptor class A domain-containing protein 1-like [Crassostrea virginica]
MRGSGQTPSRDTGPYTDGSGNPQGYYMFVEASDGFTGDMTYLWFPPLEITKNSSLHFTYHMYGDHIGTLSVVVQDIPSGSISKPWSKSGNQWQYWHKKCINIPASSSKIFFVAEKGSGHRSDIALDDVVLLDTKCSDEANIDCEFEDEYLCGYINQSTSPWNRVSYGDSNYVSSKADKTGHYMMSSSSGTSVMMSPSHMHRGGKSCVQFSFFAEKREANSSSGLSVQLWEESVQNTKKVMWNRNQSSDGYWQNGQFQLDLPAGISAWCSWRIFKKMDLWLLIM